MGTGTSYIYHIILFLHYPGIHLYNVLVLFSTLFFKKSKLIHSTFPRRVKISLLYLGTYGCQSCPTKML